MISYAQQAEDVVLARVFADQSSGRYVDVGAGHSVEDSVTKHFYDKGWSGVNIEPSPALYSELRRARPADINLDVAIGTSAGTVTLHVVANAWGRATTDSRLAHRYREDLYWEVYEIEVEQFPLAAVLDRYPGEIDFLKIDVESAEYEVIAGAEWTRHRPRVVVVEATEPGSSVPSHEKWEPLLSEAGYRCALFDGLNRFYAHSNDQYALDRLAVPANVFDSYERNEVALLRAELAGVPAARAGESAYIQRLERELAEARKSIEIKDHEIARAEQRRATELRAKARTDRYVAALELRITELGLQPVRSDQ